ncbi:MAG: PRD domain-containing protein [Bacillota bacterium]|nr:PRD domain-containing protein [Bacillota bacterium]
MAIIKKVLNSSVVMIEDENQKDYIVLGKGIGYGKKRNENIDIDSREYQLYLPLNHPKTKQIIDLLYSISPAVFEVTTEIIEMARKELRVKFNDSLYFTLSDHLNFALERYKENLVVKNRLLWEIKNFYEAEYEAGYKALEIFNKKFNVELPEDEAVNIAFHFVNAQFPEDSKQDSAKTAKLIGEIVNLVMYSLSKQIDKKSIHYVRFLTHIRFFVERYFDDKMIDDNYGLYLTIHDKCKKEEEIANKIRTLLIKKYQKDIPNEEIAFLTIHINRLNRE